MFGGIGHEQVRVLGKPRKSFRMVDVVIATKYIKNFRLAKVYEPRIIDYIDKHQWADNTQEIAKWMIDDLNKNHIEIRRWNRCVLRCFRQVIKHAAWSLKIYVNCVSLYSFLYVFELGLFPSQNLFLLIRQLLY